jgi:hypothetical protein
MDSDHHLSAIVTSTSGKIGNATVSVHSYSRMERSLRGIGIFVVWFLIAAVSILIPILHFILVPLFLLIGVAHAFSRAATVSIVKEGSGTCPECGAPFTIVSRALRWPFSEVCDGCSRQLQISENKV